MDLDIKKWIERNGVEFLKNIGIGEGNIVLDFGCGEGHYTIPAAKVVGKNGRVYALDKDRGVLNKLKQIAAEEKLENIEIIQTETKIPLEDDFLDVALCYDVIHYEKNREKIYKEVNRTLKKDGLFSIYPKHYKDDFPLMELASLSLEDIIKEVEKIGFIFEKKLVEICLHDDYYNECQILNFRKRGK